MFLAMFSLRWTAHDEQKSALSNRPFRFLDLPPEIRNQIASLVLVSDEPIRIRQPQYNRHADASPGLMFPVHPRLDFPLPRTPSPNPIPSSSETGRTQRLCAGSRSRDGYSRLALLMTCRQLYAEHWATYYSSNVFAFTPSTWPAFGSAVPAHCLGQLRHVRVRMPYRSRHIQTWKALGELENLQIVDVILAPPGDATRLERMNCIQGVRFCTSLRRIKIEREGIGEGVGPLADEKEKREIAEDRRVEKSINKDLLIRWRRNCKGDVACKGSSISSGGDYRRATAMGDCSILGRRAWRIVIMPDERAMDAYFSAIRTGSVDGHG